VDKHIFLLLIICFMIFLYRIILTIYTHFYSLPIFNVMIMLLCTNLLII